MVSLTISLSYSRFSASLHHDQSHTPSICSSLPSTTNSYSYLIPVAPPPYQAGTHQAQTYPHSYQRIGHCARLNSEDETSSLENLLPVSATARRIRSLNSDTDNFTTKDNLSTTKKMVWKRNSTAAAVDSEAVDGIPIERRKSFGRGGAGNIRRPSAVPYAAHVSDYTDEDGTVTARRRSSAWSAVSGPSSSSSSPDGRRASILNLFGLRKKRSYSRHREEQ